MAIIHHHYSPPRVTIEDALDQFLEYQSTRVPAVVHIEYEKTIGRIKARLNDDGYGSLSNGERAYFKSRSRKTFCETFGPEKFLPEVRKLLNSMQAGTGAATYDTIRTLKGMIRRLAIWLHQQGYHAESPG